MKPSIETILVGAAMTVAAVALQAVADTDFSTVTDLRAWAVGVAVASVRQAAIFILPYIRLLIPSGSA